MNLLLINCKIDAEHLRLGFERYPAEEPLGLLSIATSIRSRVDQLCIIDENLDGANTGDHREILNSFSPDIIGLSATSFSQLRLQEISRLVREVLPECKIVCGGAAAGPLHRTLLLEQSADFCIIGEGETALGELIRFTQGSLKDISKVPNLSYLEGKKVKFTFPYREDLDILPPPDRGLIDQNCYRNIFIAVTSSRGCSFPCTYCSSPLKEHRHRSPSSVVDETEAIQRSHPDRFIYFREDNFLHNKKRVIALCQEMNRRGTTFRWRCQGRVESITPEIVRALASANCFHVNLGVDVLDGNSARMVKKHYRLSSIQRALHLIESAGMSHSANILFGLPFSSRTDYYKVMYRSFLLNTPKIHIYEYVGIPGSELYTFICKNAPIRESVGDVKYPSTMYMPHLEMKLYKEALKVLLRLSSIRYPLFRHIRRILDGHGGASTFSA